MARFWSVAMVVALAGCGQTAKNGAGGGGSSSTGGSMSTGSAGAPAEEACESASAEPPDVAARLLADFELKNELEGFGEPLDALPVSPRMSRLATDDYQEPATGVLVEQVMLLSEAIAGGLSTDPAKLGELIGCDLAADGEAACRDKLNDWVQLRLFRGLASADAAAELDAVFDTGQELGGDFASGVRAVLEVALQSPELLYRIEFGRAAPDKDASWAEATDFEMASRLSFLLWDRGPDDELLTAAGEGKLSALEDLEAQARRLLADERSRGPVRRFHRSLLSVYDYQPDPSLVPGFDGELSGLVAREFDGFVDDALFSGPGDFAALFQPVSWLNGPLATYYGLSGPSGDAFQRVELDPARYGGILTQASWLYQGSIGSNPTRRGYIVSTNLLCNPIPPEPPDLAFPGPPSTPPGPLTTRQLYQIHAADPVCVSCHRMMDPIGFGLEHFDGAGRYRDKEEGLPIDATGEIVVTDAAGPFDGAGQLAARIAASQDARDCYATEWARFAYGKLEADTNECAHQTLIERFREADSNVVELLVGLTQTESFRYRKRIEAGK